MLRATSPLWNISRSQAGAIGGNRHNATAAKRRKQAVRQLLVTGRNGPAWYALVCSGPSPRVELYFGSSDAEINQEEFEKFLACREQLEDSFGGRLDFQPLPVRKACRIAAHAPEPFDVLDHDQHAALAQWFLDTMARFRTATQEVRTLVAAP